MKVNGGVKYHHLTYVNVYVKILVVLQGYLFLLIDRAHFKRSTLYEVLLLLFKTSVKLNMLMDDCELYLYRIVFSQ